MLIFTFLLSLKLTNKPNILKYSFKAIYLSKSLLTANSSSLCLYFQVLDSGGQIYNDYFSQK